MSRTSKPSRTLLKWDSPNLWPVNGDLATSRTLKHTECESLDHPAQIEPLPGYAFVNGPIKDNSSVKSSVLWDFFYSSTKNFEFGFVFTFHEATTNTI